ncbi:nitrate- and nitrite sensing domain-containing protein [soil metagenome]
MAATSVRSRWRGIRTRLIAVLIIPTLAAVVLGAINVTQSIQDSVRYTRASSLADILPSSFTLALSLSTERDTLAGKLDTGLTNSQILKMTREASNSWLAQVADINTAGNPELAASVRESEQWLAELGRKREEIFNPSTVGIGVDEYTGQINRLTGMSTLFLPLQDETLIQRSVALSYVGEAAEALNRSRNVVTQALATGEFDNLMYLELSDAAVDWEATSRAFANNADPEVLAAFNATNQTDQARLMFDNTDRLLLTRDPSTLEVDAATWQQATMAYLSEAVQFVRLAADNLAEVVNAKQADARRTAILNAAVLFGILIASIILTILVARSILKPLGILRRAALNLANTELPERVREMESGEGDMDLSVEPIKVGSKDEIADVAAALDAVHSQAIILAGEQAQLRENINKMFVNLSRRSQSLVDRQLKLLDELEAGEQDPDQLASLFRIDHLATRMRRNDESLMVLAGIQGRAPRGNVAILDVLRAASSEVEQYARVQIESESVAELPGSVGGDLVHLLAELIENATNFSPPDTQVLVRTSENEAGFLTIEISDHGIGMTAEELDAANAKLRENAPLDADVARMMGLVVASRLAHRSGLYVELGNHEPRGVVAEVVVPPELLANRADQVAPALPQPLPEPTPEPTPEPETGAPSRVGAMGKLQSIQSLRSKVAADGDPETLPGPVAAPAAAAPAAPPNPLTDPLSDTGGSGLPSRVPAASLHSALRSEPATEPLLPTRTPAQSLNPELRQERPASVVEERAETPVDPLSSAPLSLRRTFGEPEADQTPDAAADSVPDDSTSGEPAAREEQTATKPDAAVEQIASQPDVAEDVKPESAWFTKPRNAEELLNAFLAGGRPTAGITLAVARPAAQPDAASADSIAAPAASFGEPLVEPAPRYDDPSLDLEIEDQPEADPLFGTMDSGWFKPKTAEVVNLADRRGVSEEWASPGDDGWRRAAEVTEDETVPVTGDGLPSRVPGEHLIPGSASLDREESTPEEGPAAKRAPHDPRRARGLASFQAGVSRARTNPLDGPDPLTDAEPARVARVPAPVAPEPDSAETNATIGALPTRTPSASLHDALRSDAEPVTVPAGQQRSSEQRFRGLSNFQAGVNRARVGGAPASQDTTPETPHPNNE